jgi:hypothetical protein
MNTISSNMWKKRGSSVVFDPAAIAELLRDGALVSLRTALGWRDLWPTKLPVAKGTVVLIGGLETLVNELPKAEAERFLKERVHAFIREFQERWPGYALVFGLGQSEKAFEVTGSAEEVLLKRVDGDAIRLSTNLWNGSSTMHMCELVREEQGGKTVRLGFYVSHIS